MSVNYLPIDYMVRPYQRSNQDTLLLQKPLVNEGDWVQNGDIIAECSASIGGELALGQNLYIAYMPWDGYNFEDAVLISERLVFDDVMTSISIEKYDVEIKETEYGRELFTRFIPYMSKTSLYHLDQKGIARMGSWVEEGTILVGKITPLSLEYISPYRRLLYSLLDKEDPNAIRDSSLRAPKGIQAKVIDVHIYKNKEQSNSAITNLNFSSPEKIDIYLAEKRRIKRGDKIAGRHGNKGIVSQILPITDMPYLPDGTPIDVVLNPLGVPSRMNVGQLYECLLGLAGQYLGQRYKIIPFDEVYGADASRSFVFSQLYEARKKTRKNWLFNPSNPGKMRIFDGRTGESFHQPVTVGIAYMLKLVHMVDDKINARSTGPYSLVTQQPLRGRARQGGQRVGEMEVWALEGYGAAYVLLEMLTLKSDDISGRLTMWTNIVTNNEIHIGSPESFKVLVAELQSLCLDIRLFTSN
jgi:DNA-directed RNA polymerase subunit beta